MAKFPDQSLVGYLAAYGSTNPPNVNMNMIMGAINAGYKILIYAFGTINNDNIVNGPVGVSESELRNQIQHIQDHNCLALISFGGQNNTFNPGRYNSAEAAKSIVDFCNDFGFDGIDLDLEDVAVGQEYLLSMMDSIRQLRKDIIITAAPQIAGGYGGPAALAPQRIFSDEFIQKALFDAVLVQEYNQYGGAVFDGLQDTDRGFISASFDPLTNIVPEQTKIVVGEPANASAGTGLSNPAEIVDDIQSSNVLSNPQYGGIMTWNINVDSTQNWSFAEGVKAVT